jgi:hypothetical protein
MPGKNVWARLDRLIGEVSNLSLTGALLVLDEPFAADCVATLTLVRRSAGLTVQVRVIRSGREKSSPRWLVAVTFLDLSDAMKRAIPELLN